MIPENVAVQRLAREEAGSSKGGDSLPGSRTAVLH
jgi:hypothetical protein